MAKSSKVKLPEADAEFMRPAAHHGAERAHRGGAWKVAYADFVTALMALFIVLWMMNSSTQVKKSITGYFKDPKGYTKALGAGPGSSGEGVRIKHDDVADIRQKMEAALHSMPEFQQVRDNVRFSVTGEGLRIDLLETEQGMFFVTGSPSPTSKGQKLLRLLAAEISKLNNNVVIEGHTDSTAFRNAAPESGYGNWDLSADRANAARRLLHTYGVRPQQVVEVRGFADQKLLDPKDPQNPQNRRVSLVVKFNENESAGASTEAFPAFKK